MDRAAAIELLKAHHTFPSNHEFRAFVRTEAADIDAVLASVAAFCGLPDLNGRVEQVASSGGRWTSLRLSLPCDSAERVLDVYAHLQTLPQVVRTL
jgi:putative lipoic acid-binding regulatory protein